jgi:hypothetical protein
MRRHPAQLKSSARNAGTYPLRSGRPRQVERFEVPIVSNSRSDGHMGTAECSANTRQIQVILILLHENANTQPNVAELIKVTVPSMHCGFDAQRSTDFGLPVDLCSWTLLTRGY